MPIFVPGGGIELRKLAVVVYVVFGASVDGIVHFHNGRLVAASVAVVGRRKNGDDGSVVLPLVSFHDQLMRSSDKVQSVDMGELLGNVHSKGVPCSPR